MLTDNHFHWLALKSVAGVGNVTFKRLLERFLSPQEVFSATFNDIREVQGVGEDVAKRICSFSSHDIIKKELDKADKMGISIITFNDESYPKNLRSIYDPPPIIYAKGSLMDRDETAIAVVGSRTASSYGLSMSEKISKEMASKGITIISGFARGIDSRAHKGAISAKGRTIAVFGCGIDVIYPPENKKLAEEIMDSGAIISEFPIGRAPEASNFPMRNRIISGLSRGVLVIEAAQKSGSLITAYTGLEQGRDIFAVPGNVGLKNSAGTNGLIKSGAKLVESADDIIEEISPSSNRQWEEAREKDMKEDPPALNIKIDLSPEEEIIYNFLSPEPVHIDEITVGLNLPSFKVASLLLSLELKGPIKRLYGGMFVRKEN